MFRMRSAGESNGVGEFWRGRWQSGHTPWDHGRPAPPFAEFVERAGPPQGDLLVPGCGSGHDVRYFAELGARVTGLDIAPTAVEVARQRNSHPNAEYQCGDFLNLEPRWHGRFDWVAEHTCLCALPPACWPAYRDAVRRALRPGGRFLVIFYRRPHDPEGPPFGITAEQIGELFDAGFTLLEAWVPRRSYASRAGREELRCYECSGSPR